MVYLYSTIKMMHGPLNIRLTKARIIKPHINKQIRDAKFLEDPFIRGATVQIQPRQFTAAHTLRRFLYVCSK